MKILNLGCENAKRIDFAFHRHARANPRQIRVVAGRGVISIAPRRTRFGHVSVSRRALCFPPLIVKPPKLAATSDDAAKSSSTRLKGLELREEEFQGEAGQWVDKFGYATFKPH